MAGVSCPFEPAQSRSTGLPSRSVRSMISSTSSGRTPP